MENKKISTRKGIVKTAIAAAAKMATISNVNSTCGFVIHQPKLPKDAKKLRKF